MVDVVPGLLADIETAFQTNTIADRTLARVSAKIRDGTATQADGHTYALRLGKNASKALQQVLTPEALPDSKLYYNIATRTVIPTLKTNQTLINNAAAEIQTNIDLESNIHLKSIKPKFPDERINGLIDKMTADGIAVDEALKWLAEPIVNNSEAFFDDFVRENAEFRHDSGLKTTITRTAESKACEWCKDLEGTYEYGNAPENIYRRHEFCRCTVTVTSQRDRTSQNVWSKKTWKSSEEELQRRINTKPERQSAEERQQILEQMRQENQRNTRRR